MQKTLVIIRHAKAETGSPGQDDKSRGLSARGREATGIVGNYLKEKGLVPGLVLCSDAVRTTETLLGIEHVYGRPLPVQYTPKLYHASANEMLNVISEAEPSVDVLFVVGHNPGMHELAMKLAQHGSEALIDRMAVKYPTCAAATFACHTPGWEGIRQGRCELLDFASPKMLGQMIG